MKSKMKMNEKPVKKSSMPKRPVERSYKEPMKSKKPHAISDKKRMK